MDKTTSPPKGPYGIRTPVSQPLQYNASRLERCEPQARWYPQVQLQTANTHNVKPNEDRVSGPEMLNNDLVYSGYVSMNF